jgi:hypothetical protein
MGGAVALDAPVVDAAVALLRSALVLRRSAGPLLMLLLCGAPLLMLLTALPPTLLTALLPVLCVDSSGSEEQEQNCCADNARSFHLFVFLLSAVVRWTLSPSSLC